MKSILYVLIAFSFIFINCATTDPNGFSSYRASYSDSDPVLAKSLFASDHAVISQAAIDTILSSKIIIPEDAKLALIKFSGSRASG